MNIWREYFSKLLNKDTFKREKLEKTLIEEEGSTFLAYNNYRNMVSEVLRTMKFEEAVGPSNILIRVSKWMGEVEI